MDRSTTSLVFSVVFVFMLISRVIDCEPGKKKFNVMDFGAIGNSYIDDTEAFTKTWDAACYGAVEKDVTPLFQVPKGKIFFVNRLTFLGPCKSPTIHFQVRGHLIAPKSPSDWNARDYWIMFRNVDGLKLTVPGVLDGRGSEWWDRNPTDPRPSALSFSNCDDLVVDGLTSIDSPRNHVTVNSCERATFSDINLIAPDDSPNTDGIDVANSKYITIKNSFIGSGDDCIAIGNDTMFVNITGVNCGPGHGISIGSLGQNGAIAAVEEIHVKNCTFNGTMNGARIKSWQGGSGYARKITFDDITLINTSQPIILDQHYCPHDIGCTNKTKAVHFSDVSFTGFRGTSDSTNAIILNCSQTVACTNIYLDRIDIDPTGEVQKTESTCINAHGKCGDNVSPKVDCLLH